MSGVGLGTDNMRRAGDRRAALLDQLEAIFFADGVDSVSVDALAQRLKCSKRDLYQIGASKRDMALAVIARWSERIAQAATVAMQSADPETQLSAYLTPGVVESRAISRQFLRDIAGQPALDAALRTHQRKRIAGLAEILSAGVEAGVYRPVNVELVAALCIGAIDRLDDPAILEASGTDFGAAFETFYGLLMNGLRRTPA